MSNIKTDKVGSKLYLEWEREGVEAEVSRVHESKSALNAHVVISYTPKRVEQTGQGHHLIKRSWNLFSQQSINSVVKALEARDTFDINWESIIEQLVVTVDSNSWEVSDSATIGNDPIVYEDRHVLYPFVRKNQINMIYGSAGIGKSYIAVTAALCVQTGIAHKGLIPEQGNVLYLDWESERDDLNERTVAVKEGFKDEYQNEYLDQAEFEYRKVRGSLDKVQDEISDVVHSNNVKLIIVDSVGGALQGNINDADAIAEFSGILRSYNTSVLALDHVAKGNNDKPIGSIYKEAFARNLWRMSGDHPVGSDEMEIAFEHTKTNHKRMNPVAFDAKFYTDSTYDITNKFTIKSKLIDDSSLLKRDIEEVLYEQILLNPGMDRNNLINTLDKYPQTEIDITLETLLRTNKIMQDSHGGYGTK
tara:strand:+ start:464 stop:1720 length:1257 start_codon:yes stop_codon:yes gene_type:complete